MGRLCQRSILVHHVFSEGMRVYCGEPSNETPSHRSRLLEGVRVLRTLGYPVGRSALDWVSEKRTRHEPLRRARARFQ